MKAKSPEDRKCFVQQARICDNCLGSGHMALDCRSKMKCQVNGCGWKHRMLRRRATGIASLLTILQSPRRRLERVPSVQPGSLEQVPLAGLGCWSVWCCRLWREQCLFKNLSSCHERKRSAEHNCGKRTTGSLFGCYIM